MDHPRMLFCDRFGQIYDEPRLAATARLGVHPVVPKPEDWIPLPEGSDIFSLPDRTPVGWLEDRGRFRVGSRDTWAVSAFTPPGYVRSHLPNGRPQPSADPLPLWAYSAAGWRDDGFYVTAFPIEQNPKGDLAEFDEETIRERVRQKLDEHPENRLLNHLAHCALQNNCLAAKNYFLGRWEAGLPVSRECPSSCEGCISNQPAESLVPASHARIAFRPTLEEALEVIVPHLEEAPLAMVSFGQGCEGEPLCEDEFLEELIREVRGRTSRGTIHLNTNGYAPAKLQRLAKAGLNSVRISINSVRKDYYHRYHKPQGYTFEDVETSVQVGVAEGLYVSINYLIFPGLTDHQEEIDAFTRFLERTGTHMVQWKNLNIDPDVYIRCLELESLSRSEGMRTAVDTIRHRLPQVRFGYFNPPREQFEESVKTDWTK